MKIEGQKQWSLNEGSLMDISTDSASASTCSHGWSSCKGGWEMNFLLMGEKGLCAQLKFDYDGKRRMNLGAPLADFAAKIKGAVCWGS